MLTDKIVVITGAFSGIGKAATELFMQSKCKVVGIGRNDTNKVPSYTGNYLPIVRDIKDEHDAEAIRDFTHDKFGKPDIIVHAAGKVKLAPAHELAFGDYQRIMRDNFYTAVLTTQAFLPDMMEAKKGTLIFLPGVAGRASMSMPGGTAYAAAKYALTGYAKSLREDLKRTSIRSTCLFFGGVDTELWEDVEAKLPKDKFISTQDAAKAVWYAAQQPETGVMSEMVLQPFFHQAI